MHLGEVVIGALEEVTGEDAGVGDPGGHSNMSSSPTGCCAVHYTGVGWMFTMGHSVDTGVGVVI